MPDDKSYEAQTETPTEKPAEAISEPASRVVQDTGYAESGAQVDPQTEQAAKPQPTEDFFIAEEYGDSFAALKKSMEQGYDLKMKQKAYAEYTSTLNTLKDAHSDRVNIAQNFNALVEEQENLIAAGNAELDSCNAQIHEIEAQIDAKNNELVRVKKEQEQALKPLEEELALAEAKLASANDEFKQVKAQRDSLDLFEAEPQDAQQVQDSHNQVVADVEAKRESAKAAQKAAQRALDDQARANKAEQRAISDEIKKLDSKKSEVARYAQEQQKRVSTAKERIAFCNHVIAHPEETEKMQQRIVENEATAAEMNTQIEQLSVVHEKSVRASSKARGVIIVGVIAVIVLIILFIIVGNR